MTAPARMAGKVVVVTGAAGGQGAGTARLLVTAGATVIGCDLTAQPVEDLSGAEYRRLDVTDATGWAVLAADLRDRFGRVDGLVANAGTTWRARLTREQDIHREHHRPGARTGGSRPPSPPGGCSCARGSDCAPGGGDAS